MKCRTRLLCRVSKYVVEILGSIALLNNRIVREQMRIATSAELFCFYILRRTGGGLYHFCIKKRVVEMPQTRI